MTDCAWRDRETSDSEKGDGGEKKRDNPLGCFHSPRGAATADDWGHRLLFHILSGPHARALPLRTDLLRRVWEIKSNATRRSADVSDAARTAA